MLQLNPERLLFAVREAKERWRENSWLVKDKERAMRCDISNAFQDLEQCIIDAIEKKESEENTPGIT